MNSFDRSALNHIKDIFESKTGVELASSRPVRHPIRTSVVFAVVIVCLFTMTAFALSLFSSLSGDELSLSASYEGAGVVSILVENKSDRDLNFQSDLKLMRWTTGQEVAPLSGAVAFQNARIPAHSSGTMTVDLSQAYDLALLEKPLVDDWYCIVLTNNHFLFGQDWMCSVDFADTTVKPTDSVPPVEPDTPVVQGVEDSLRFYFETVSFDVQERRALNTAYVQAYTRLFDEFDGTIVPSVSPVLPGNRLSSAAPGLTVGDPAPGVVFDAGVPAEEQRLLVGSHWSSSDPSFKLLATESEHALVLSAALPLQRYQDTSAYLPVLYLLTYEKAALEGEQNYALIYGQLLSFADLSPYQIYEDDTYVCYEVSSLIYSDLEEYVQRFASQNRDIRFDAQTWTRVENIYRYYKENIGTLLAAAR